LNFKHHLKALKL